MQNLDDQEKELFVEKCKILKNIMYTDEFIEKFGLSLENFIALEESILAVYCMNSYLSIPEFKQKLEILFKRLESYSNQGS